MTLTITPDGEWRINQLWSRRSISSTGNGIITSPADQLSGADPALLVDQLVARERSRLETEHALGDAHLRQVQTRRANLSGL